MAFRNLIQTVHFYNCIFTSNNAQYGGAVYFGMGNGNDLSNTGLITLIDFVNVTIRHNNAALDGGGIYANNQNIFSILYSWIVGNVAGRSGGGIALYSNNTITISKLTSFVHNSAETDGGALAMNTGSIVTFNETTTFDSNYAKRYGGALVVSASTLVLGPNNITFVNNSALSGSALYLMSSSTSTVILLNASNDAIMFRNNMCQGGKGGGTVFYVKDLQTTTVLFGPQMPNYNQRVVFDNNKAAVGSGVATQTTSLRSTSNQTTIIVTDYNLFLQPSLLVFNLVDAVNNINTTDFASTVIIFQTCPTLSPLI